MHFSANEDFCLRPELLMRAGPTVFRIVSIIGETVMLERTDTLEKRVAPLSLILNDYRQGKLLVSSQEDMASVINGDAFHEDDMKITTCLPLETLSQPQIKYVLRVMRYINALRRLGHVKLSPRDPILQMELNRIQKKIDDPQPVKAAWVYSNWLKYTKADCDPRAVIPGYDRRGGRNGKRLHPVIQSVIDSVLEERVAKKAEPADQGREKDVESKLSIEHQNHINLIGQISRSTVDRRIQEKFGAYEICKRIRGKEVADRLYREWYHRDRAEFPLEVYETDDTDSCVFMIDEVSGLPAGRGYITGVVDQHCDVLTGWDLSHEPRSSWSAISAVVDAILPKDSNHPIFTQTRSGCEFYGRPSIVVFDNALQNHSSQIELAASSMRIIPAWAKPKTPTEKSCIEGMNGRIKSEFLPALPGFRGDKHQREGLKHGMASSNMGLLGFQQMFAKWAMDDAANTPRDDGLTPRQRWQLGMRLSRPRLPRDVNGLKIEACLHVTLRLRPEHIRLAEGLNYWHPFVQVIRKKHGHNAEALIRYNPKNLFEIFVFDPEGKRYVLVHSTNPEYTKGLSLYQHKLIKQMASEAGLKNPTIQQLLFYREELRYLTNQLRYSKKMKERKQAMRVGEVPKSKDITIKTESTIVVTELEDTIMSIQEVEMDMSEEGWGVV
ncbi:MAG: hypothetical protein IPG66_19070 [Hydrogenophilales bacterium]|nr:hypothetical protein [Hydrogenophilales bacterium]